MTQSSALPLSPTELLQLNQQLQGLLPSDDDAACAGDGPERTLQSIQQLSYVQIDSIYVVERAHHHVLSSRVADYQPCWLAQLLQNRQVFEYWSHAAAYLPMADYRFSLYRKQQLQHGDKHWFTPDQPLMQAVKNRIWQEGPLKASDFVKTTVKTSGWWDWQPAKKALEQLFMQGELMVVRRDKFQKVYDFTERVLPAGVDQRVPNETEMASYLIRRYLQSHGFGTAAQMSYLRQGLKSPVFKQLLERKAGGEFGSFQYQGQQYFYPLQLPKLRQAPAKVWLLNPFDNLLIQRQRVQHWLAVDYQLEVYIPAEKRRIGYYNLAIMYQQQWYGQVDVKADRHQQVLLLQHLVLIEAVPWSDAFGMALLQALAEYAAFNGCCRWQLVKANSEVSVWLAKMQAIDSKGSQ